MNNFYAQFVKLFNETFSDALIDEISNNYSISQTELKQLFDKHLLGTQQLQELSVPTKKASKVVNLTKETKPKKTVNRKVPDDDKRCIALTKGNDRCKSSQSNKNGHSLLCSLHTKNGVDKYGVLDEYKEQYFIQQQPSLAPIEDVKNEEEQLDEVDDKIEKLLTDKNKIKLEFVE